MNEREIRALVESSLKGCLDSRSSSMLTELFREVIMRMEGVLYRKEGILHREEAIAWVRPVLGEPWQGRSMWANVRSKFVLKGEMAEGLPLPPPLPEEIPDQRFVFIWLHGTNNGTSDVQERRAWRRVATTNVLSDGRWGDLSDDKQPTFVLRHSYRPGMGVIEGAFEQLGLTRTVGMRTEQWAMGSQDPYRTDPMDGDQGRGSRSSAHLEVNCRVATTGVSPIGFWRALQTLRNVAGEEEAVAAVTRYFVKMQERLDAAEVWKPPEEGMDKPLSEERAMAVIKEGIGTRNSLKQRKVTMASGEIASMEGKLELARVRRHWLSLPALPTEGIIGRLKDCEDVLRMWTDGSYLFIEPRPLPLVVTEEEPVTASVWPGEYMMPPYVLRLCVDPYDAASHPYIFEATRMGCGRAYTAHTHVSSGDGKPCMGHGGEELAQWDAILLAMLLNDPVGWVRWWQQYMITSNTTGGYNHIVLADGISRADGGPKYKPVEEPEPEPEPEPDFDDDDRDDEEED